MTEEERKVEERREIRCKGMEIHEWHQSERRREEVRQEKLTRDKWEREEEKAFNALKRLESDDRHHTRRKVYEKLLAKEKEMEMEVRAATLLLCNNHIRLLLAKEEREREEVRREEIWACRNMYYETKVKIPELRDPR